MKIKLLITLFICTSFFNYSFAYDSKTKKQINTNKLTTSENITSLRGVNGIKNLSVKPITKRVIKNGDYERNFDLQPPLVPHKSNHMSVTLKNNKCLECHSNSNYREEESVKMPPSHFKSRLGKRLKQISYSRYFCKQCHVSQVDAKPLIENTYINTDE